MYDLNETNLYNVDDLVRTFQYDRAMAIAKATQAKALCNIDENLDRLATAVEQILDYLKAQQ